MTENDKDIFKQLMRHPGWALLEKELRETSKSYSFQATMPSVDEHYRLILFSKAEGILEVFDLVKELIK